MSHEAEGSACRAQKQGLSPDTPEGGYRRCLLRRSSSGTQTGPTTVFWVSCLTGRSVNKIHVYKPRLLCMNINVAQKAEKLDSNNRNYCSSRITKHRNNVCPRKQRLHRCQQNVCIPRQPRPKHTTRKCILPLLFEPKRFDQRTTIVLS